MASARGTLSIQSLNELTSRTDYNPNDQHLHGAYTPIQPGFHEYHEFHTGINTRACPRLVRSETGVAVRRA